MVTIQPALSRRIWNRNKKGVHKALKYRLRSQQEPQKGRFMMPDIDRILDQAQKSLDDLIPSIAVQKSWGNNFRVIFLGIVHLAIYHGLLKEGIEKDYAIYLLNDIIWKSTIESWRYRILKFFIRLITSDPYKQVGIQLRFLGRNFYTPPGYEHELSLNSNAYYWNFYRCAPLEFYRTQGQEALEMFRKTYCVIDFASAELMAKGVRYERPHTLTDGDNVCDMRWDVVR